MGFHMKWGAAAKEKSVEEEANTHHEGKVVSQVYFAMYLSLIITYTLSHAHTYTHTHSHTLSLSYHLTGKSEEESRKGRKGRRSAQTKPRSHAAVCPRRISKQSRTEKHDRKHFFLKVFVVCIVSKNGIKFFLVPCKHTQRVTVSVTQRTRLLGGQSGSADAEWLDCQAARTLWQIHCSDWPGTLWVHEDHTVPRGDVWMWRKKRTRGGSGTYDAILGLGFNVQLQDSIT